MPQSIDRIVSSAATANGWETPADFWLALKSAGVDVVYATAWNWWHGKSRPSRQHAGDVADVCDVAHSVVYGATLKGVPDE